MQQPFVTILVPIRNEANWIVPCLHALCAQDYPQDRLEILVIDGQSTDHSVKLVMHVMEEDARICLLENPRRSQAAGLNLGIRQAKGEIVIRADAHAAYGPSYVSRCVAHLTAGRAENVGGLQRAQGTSRFSAAVAVALGTVFGSGNAPYRLATAQRYADTVWLGAWYRTTLEQLGGYNEDLITNEDYELNWRLREQQGRILLDPALPGAYYPRNSLAKLFRQYFRYGIGKLQMLRRYPDSLVLRQLAAPLLVLGLLVTAALASLTLLPFLVLAGSYLAAVLGASLSAGLRHGLRHLCLLPCIYLAIHLSWGLGFCWGALRHGLFAFRFSRMLESERLVRRGEVARAHYAAMPFPPPGLLKR